MSALGDSRRLRAAMALNRVSGEIVTASGEFLKSSPNESISKLETSITRLLRTAGSSYNESVKSDGFTLRFRERMAQSRDRGAAARLQPDVPSSGRKPETSLRSVTKYKNAPRPLLSTSTTLQNLENSRAQLEKQLHQLASNEGSLLETIERIESDSAIRALNAKEAETQSAEKEAPKRRDVQTGRGIHEGSVIASKGRSAYPFTGNRSIDAVCENPADDFGEGIRWLP